jgi:hypothetical protein
VRRSVPKPYRLAGLLMLPVLLSACAQNTVATVEQMCSSIRPISVSKCDVLSEQTASEIEADNLSKQAWCGKQEVERRKGSCTPAKPSKQTASTPIS